MLAFLLAAALLQTDAASTMTTPPAAASDDAALRGAPAPDYDFVAWCHGALAGHMALYEHVKPELVSIEQPGEVAADEKNDRLQLQAGRDYLALYSRALNGVDHARPGALLQRRRTAEAQGAAIWEPFKTAPPRQQMWAWVGWNLPGRCETAAKALETPKGRLAALHSLPPSLSDAAAPAGAAPQSIDDAVAGSQAAPATAPGGEPSLRGPQ